MATHFSANQYENAFAANRLQNYQVPNDFKEHPTARKGCTKIISNDRGHLFPNVPRSKESPWGNFKGTWDDHLGLQKNRTPLKTKSNERVEENNLKTPRADKCVVAEKQQTQRTEPEMEAKRVQIVE